MAAIERPPVFELHIQPMFRLMDREHMLSLVEPGFDLWDVDDVWRMRDAILTRLRGEDDDNMPGIGNGGPWPAEWIAVFERWLATGSGAGPGHHLELAKPDGPHKVQALGGGMLMLTAPVMAPTSGCEAWVACDSVTPRQREYTVYIEPPFPARPANPTPLKARENFEKGDAETLVIHDADGTHEVPVP